MSLLLIIVAAQDWPVAVRSAKFVRILTSKLEAMQRAPAGGDGTVLMSDDPDPTTTTKKKKKKNKKEKKKTDVGTTFDTIGPLVKYSPNAPDCPSVEWGQISKAESVKSRSQHTIGLLNRLREHALLSDFPDGLPARIPIKGGYAMPLLPATGKRSQRHSSNLWSPRDDVLRIYSEVYNDEDGSCARDVFYDRTKLDSDFGGANLSDEGHGALWERSKHVDERPKLSDVHLEILASKRACPVPHISPCASSHVH